MKYLKKYEQATISIDLERGDKLIISLISDQFKKEEILNRIEDENDETDKHTALIDMILWYENNFGQIENEDDILSQLRSHYGLN